MVCEVKKHNASAITSNRHIKIKDFSLRKKFKEKNNYYYSKVIVNNVWLLCILGKSFMANFFMDKNNSIAKVLSGNFHPIGDMAINDYI